MEDLPGERARVLLEELSARDMELAPSDRQLSFLPELLRLDLSLEHV